MVHRRLITAAALVVGAAFGMAGTFSPYASLRGLLWGLDGTALVVAGALLTVHYLRRGQDLAAAGFLVFVVGEAFILASAAMVVSASRWSFATGTALWAAALALVSASRVMPALVNAVALVAAVLFAVVAVQMFWGRALTPLTSPLPSYAYPFLAATLVGWAVVHFREAGQ